MDSVGPEDRTLFSLPSGRSLDYDTLMAGSLTLKSQEIPLDDPESNNMFRPGPDKPFAATPAAIEMYTREAILACLNLLRQKADEHQGLDYLQVFTSPEKPEDLWFMEDGAGGAITALLPSDH